ncbi:MAG: transposase [Proteobacteria bacterium]|nr:transposase [Pseudomonadota bacterium]
MARGFVYLCAVVDWFSRKVLSWRLSITLETAFCIEAVEEALSRYGKPEIFNTDQGSQFTALEFVRVLKDAGVAISMDGKGAWRDNVFVERLWRTMKYEEVYLHARSEILHLRAREFAPSTMKGAKPLINRPETVQTNPATSEFHHLHPSYLFFPCPGNTSKVQSKALLDRRKIYT